MDIHGVEVSQRTIDLEPNHHRHPTVDLLSGGSGNPIVVLHRDTGPTGWTEFHSRLAENFVVHAPTLPGFDAKSVPGWMRSVSDLAVETGHLLDVLDLPACPIVGLGFGGWVAAEIATMCSHRASALVLQAPMGIKPPEGEIFDQILVDSEDYVRTGFTADAAFEKHFGPAVSPETKDGWEAAREMTVRIAWKPYMFSLSLPYLLRVLDLPVTLIWGSDDRIVPLSCAAAYKTAIKGAELRTIENAGHQMDLENPKQLATAIHDFVNTLV